MRLAEQQVIRRASTLDRAAVIVLPVVQVIALVALPLFPREVAIPLHTQVVVISWVVIAAVDLFSSRVPNLMLYPSLLFAISGTALLDTASLDNALAGGSVLLGIMFLLALIGRGTMGMGDVKFACLTGCTLGWKSGLLALLSGFALGGAVGLGLLILGSKTRKDSVPLTPFLAAGAAVWLALHGSVLS
jgi:leader peptidase (prepilin peptidase)/N-methyltransferase